MTNKDIIKQYVDTGIKITIHQIDKLSSNLLRTYLRKQIIASKIVGDNNIITEREYFKMNDVERKNALPFIDFDILEKLDNKKAVEVINDILDIKLEDLHNSWQYGVYAEWLTSEWHVAEMLKKTKSFDIAKKIIDKIIGRQYSQPQILHVVLQNILKDKVFEAIHYYLNAHIKLGNRIGSYDKKFILGFLTTYEEHAKLTSDKDKASKIMEEIEDIKEKMKRMEINYFV